MSGVSEPLPRRTSPLLTKGLAEVRRGEILEKGYLQVGKKKKKRQKNNGLNPEAEFRAADPPADAAQQRARPASPSAAGILAQTPRLTVWDGSMRRQKAAMPGN